MLRPQKPLAIPALTARIVLVFLFVVLVTISLINARQARSAQSLEERVLDNRVPSHLPIKVKLRKEKEKAVKDLKNEEWLRDFEIEVTNTGSKPIYVLHFSLTADGVTAPDGNNIGWVLHYGGLELGDIVTKATEYDTPIKPGETYNFSLADSLQDWLRFRRRENKEDPKRLILRFQILSFGDGTGFAGTTGEAWPPAQQKSSLDRCGPEFRLTVSRPTKIDQVSWESQPAVFSTENMPARFLLADFLSEPSAKSASLKSNPQSQACCLSGGNTCFRSPRNFSFRAVGCKRLIWRRIRRASTAMRAHRMIQ